MAAAPRRTYVDWARGIAVLLMIEAHTIDSWTRAADRQSSAYRDAVILGGFAAPFFLWVAGVAVAFFAANMERRANSRAAAARAICRRGLQIFILAFLFRAQAFILTPGSPLLSLLRVDILNVMGLAIVGAGIVRALARRTPAAVAACALVTLLIAMLTPIIRIASVVDTLPFWLQWYVRPAGEHTTFTLFPWAGFVFAGAAIGMVLVDAKHARAERRAHAAMALAGASLVAGGLYAASLPAIYRQSSFWTSSPTYFAIRCGVLMLALAGLYLVSQRVSRGRALNVLERFGRSSLFVYWIHVELVYGYASWLWWRGLPLWAAVLGCVAFTALMYGAIIVRDRVVEWWVMADRKALIGFHG